MIVNGKLPNFTELPHIEVNDLNEGSGCRVAVIGDCATQHLSEAVRGVAAYSSIILNVLDIGYDQVIAQIYDDNSELVMFKPDIIVLFFCIEKLSEDFYRTKPDDRQGFAKNKASEIEKYWRIMFDKVGAKIIEPLFQEDRDSVFGNYGYGVEESLAYQVRILNCLLLQAKLGYKNIQLFDLNVTRAQLGDASYTDEKLRYWGHLPASLKALTFVARDIVDIIKSQLGLVKKCIIVDLDNTIWGGVIGDDGLEGIEIGEYGVGRAYSDLQRWLKELKNRGIILAVCSKNDEENAKNPFVNHPDMTLKLEDFSVFVANWEDKASNIRYIQETLNISMDSIVFIDDNPFERNQVGEAIPDITIPEMPENPEEYVHFLSWLNLFETASYSDEDKKRSSQYKAEAERKRIEKEYGSYEDYLKSLNMTAKYSSFTPFYYPRIAQLTQRSNQFNIRTIRYTEDQIREIAESDRYLTMYFTLSDRLGEYGLISVVILKKEDEDKLFLDEWLMSCRVLKRGMEEFIVNSIVESALNKGYKSIVGEYIPTGKNGMVCDIFSRFGFFNSGNNRYILNLNDYVKKGTFIEKGDMDVKGRNPDEFKKNTV